MCVCVCVFARKEPRPLSFLSLTLSLSLHTHKLCLSLSHTPSVARVRALSRKLAIFLSISPSHTLHHTHSSTAARASSLRRLRIGDGVACGGLGVEVQAAAKADRGGVLFCEC